MNGDRASSSEITYAGIAGAVGGMVGIAGIYVGKWFSYSYVAEGSRATFYFDGTEDWTGQVAFIAGLAAFAFGIAYILLSDPQIRTITGSLMGVGGIFLLAMAVLGFTRVDEVVGLYPFLPGIEPGQSVSITTAAAGGLWLSVVGGMAAVYGAFLSVRRGL
jgi:hypothetical protein